MSVQINRIGGDPLGISQYELYLNDTLLIPTFDHNRTDDLPALLRAAADAVGPARGVIGSDTYKNHKT